jgi:hypothetical protein
LTAAKFSVILKKQFKIFKFSNIGFRKRKHAGAIGARKR